MKNRDFRRKITFWWAQEAKHPTKGSLAFEGSLKIAQIAWCHGAHNQSPPLKEGVKCFAKKGLMFFKIAFGRVKIQNTLPTHQRVDQPQVRGVAINGFDSPDAY